jgi:hypothetical protein
MIQQRAKMIGPLPKSSGPKTEITPQEKLAGVNEKKGDKSFCQYLRVLVIATRHILPFDQLVRPSSGKAVLSVEDGRLGS